MKNYTRNLAVIAGMSALLGGSIALAQNDTKESATVPFAFHASTATLPAGKYAITVLGDQHMIQLVDRATGHSVMIGARYRESGKGSDPRLTFHRYGNEYFLSAIWMPGQSDGYKFSTTAREKELSSQPGAVTLASIRLIGK